MDSIDNCKSLKEITKRRLKRYEDQVADGDNYEGVLVGIYEKPTHFVYELLQNADDALATEVCFELFSDKLIFYHNGSKDFSLKDIISITGVGNSTKKDSRSVGKFGVGFKSVFAITDTPLIYNRAFNFRIEHLSIPYEIKPDDLNGYTTKFVLPFNSSKNKNDKDMIVEKISEELCGLDCATIMFLRNISKIHVSDRNDESEILLNREELENYELVQDLGSDKNYYLFKDGKTNISISFLVENDKICPLENVYLYSFLPTRIRSELPFYVDAPFDLATTRESIEFDSEKNKEILDKIAAFLKRILLKLRDEHYIDQDFLNDILPVNSDMCSRSRIYDRLYNELKTILRDTKLLPTTDKKYVDALESVLPLTKTMAALSNYNKSWLDIDRSHSVISNYLINELGVEKIDVLGFSSYLVDNGILKKKNNDWLLKYYTLCANNCVKTTEYWFEKSEADKLKELPIIKTRTGRFACAYTNGEAQVFRYSKGIPNSKAIHGLFTSKSLSENNKENVRQFLNMLGVKERSPRQYIESSLLAGWSSLANSGKKKTFFEICDIYNTSSSSDKADIISLLKNYKLFPVIKRGKRTWTTGLGLMRGTKEQKLVFKNAAFLQKNYWTDVIEKDKKGYELQKGSKDLCLALGIIEDLPITTTYDDVYNYRNEVEPEIEEKYEIDTANYPRWWYSKLNTVEDFDTVIAKIKNNDEVSALVQLLSRAPGEKTEDQLAGASQNGRKAFSWRVIPASYIRILNNKAWVFVNGRRHRTRDLKRDDFVEKFSLTGTEYFLDQIDFKKRFVDVASDEEKRAIRLFEGLDEDDKKKLEQHAKKLLEKKNKAEMPDDSSNNSAAKMDISEVFPLLNVETLVEDSLIIDSNDTAEHNVKSGINKHSEALEEVEKQVNHTESTSSDSSDSKKELGDAAEKCIVEILKKKYADCEVNWFGGNNEGYDIAISKNGEDIKYIEVKAVADFSGRINISPSEWNYAKDKGEDYDIYAVSASTGKYTIINNPYQQYIDGKINIEVNAILY